LEGLATEDVCTYIARPFGLVDGYFADFVAVRDILRLFGIYFTILVCCTGKNLAALA
jgi:hypothetical protein